MTPHTGYNDPCSMCGWRLAVVGPSVNDCGDRLQPVLVSCPATDGRGGMIRGSLGSSVVLEGGGNPLAVGEALSASLFGQEGEVFAGVAGVNADEFR